VGIDELVHEPRPSVLVVAEERGELFQRGIQLGVDETKDVALEEHEQRNAGNLNRDENDDDRGSEQPEAERVWDQPSTFRK
jgi:hypothetical protein